MTTNNCSLDQRKCVPCSKGTPPLDSEKIDELKSQISDEWFLVDDCRLERNFKFSNFREALEFTNLVGELAEQEGHHPDIFLSWGLVTVRLMTHKIDGLSESDFILAAKIDNIK